MFKVFWNISTSIFSNIFCRRDRNYNSRSNSEFPVPNVRSVDINDNESVNTGSYLVVHI